VTRSKDQVNYRKLNGMMIDLKNIKSELLPGDGKGAASPKELENMDDFQQKKYNLSQRIFAIKENVEKLVEKRKALGENVRDTETIKMQQSNQKDLKEALDLWSDLKKQLVKDAQRKKKKLPEAEMEDRKKATTILGNDLKDLTEKNSRVKSIDSPDGMTRREKRTQKKKEERQQRARNATRTRKGTASGADDKDGVELDDDGDFKNVGPTTAQEQMFADEVEKNQNEQNEMLDEISKGMTDLLELGQNMNATLQLQNAMLGEMEEKLDDTIEKFQTANSRLKQVLDESGGVATWCPRLICFVVLIALLGFITQAL